MSISIVPEKTALVIIDLQKGIVALEGTRIGRVRKTYEVIDALK